MMEKREVAILFGNSLDNDDYETTWSILALDCNYQIGDELIVGPENISKSYEENMIAGRKKLDRLEWGQSEIEDISEAQFYVHFTDYLTHKGIEYIHRCKQKITVGPGNLIIRIEHIDDPKEQENLDNYYKSVGLK